MTALRRAERAALVLLGCALGDTGAGAMAAHGQEAAPPPAHEDILGTGKTLYSQHDEELIIRDFFQDRRNGTFVDVGCAWPIKASNTFYLEQRLGWRGIAVDAHPDYAQAWLKRRPRTRFFNYIVTDHAGTMESVRPPEEVEGKKLGHEEIRVPTITLNQLLDENGVKKVDLLSMDIEGAELLALAGFDLARFEPELLCIEAKPQSREGVLKFFAARGYERLERYLERDPVNFYFTPKRAGNAPGLQ